MEVTRCSVSLPRTSDVRTHAPGGCTNAYVLGGEGAVLVDPAARTPELDRLVSGRRIDHVFLTHAHPDHAHGVREYVRRTDATLWARSGYADRLREVAGVEPDRTFTPGTTVHLDQGGERERVTVLDAPGHAPDHVALVAGDGGPICCGDCAVADGSVAVGAPDGDVRAYLTTLRRLRVMDPPVLLPGHGSPITDPRATLERLLAHRLQRERRVRAAVFCGARTLDAILEFAYEADLDGVRDLARRTVVAHLEKLAVEGDLEWNGTRARPIEPSGSLPSPGNDATDSR